MKNNTGLVLMICILLVNMGCKKALEQIHNINGNETCCRVESIHFTLDSSESFPLRGDFTVRFSYNLLGNPTSAIFDKFDYTGKSGLWPDYNLYFQYDNQSRLSVIGYKYIDGNYMAYVHKIFYQADSIIVDSIYSNVIGWPNNLSGQYNSYTKHRLDSKGRIITTFTDQSPLDYISISYTYDANGNRNLHTDKTTAYDDKTNLRRTNKVWQYMDRDYSINNAIETIAGGYNSYGLPNQILPKPLTGYFPWFDTQFFADFIFTGKEQITYSCSK